MVASTRDWAPPPKTSPPCPTCGKIDQCAGHYGIVKFALPVFHAGYFKHVLAALQCVCRNVPGHY